MRRADGCSFINPFAVADLDHELNINTTAEARCHGAEVVETFFHLILGQAYEGAVICNPYLVQSSSALLKAR
jgi:hypothetical protein